MFTKGGAWNENEIVNFLRDSVTVVVKIVVVLQKQNENDSRHVKEHFISKSLGC